MIEMGKTYKTVNGRDVRLVAIENGWAFGFVGSMRPCMWAADSGKASDRFPDLGGADTDLREVKPTITRTEWRVQWEVGWDAISAGYPSYEAAKKYVDSKVAYARALAITGPVTVTFTPGDGL